MADISVKLLQCAVANSGRLKVDHIGAGVGVILYSAAKKTGAGVHILAPKSGTIQAKNPVMYTNTAIPHVLGQLQDKGVNPPFSIAIAGGAGMMGKETVLSSGKKVADAVKDALAKVNLNVKIDQTGGNKVRTMILDIDAGRIKIT